MKTLPKPDVPLADPDQEWINKYRAAIANSEPPTKLSVTNVISRIGCLMGIAVRESQKLVTEALGFARGSRPELARPRPREEIVIASTKRKRASRKPRRGKFAA